MEKKNTQLSVVKVDVISDAVPLDPASFADTEENLRALLGADILVPIEKNLETWGRASRDDPDLDIKSCPTSLFRCLSLLADGIFWVKLSDVSRVAAERGTKILWFLTGVGELAEIHRSFMQRAPHETHALVWFEKATFDLQTSDTGRLHGRIRQKDKESLYKLAEVVGLRHRPSTVMVLALAAGIVGSNRIPATYNNQFAKLIARFGLWIKERLRFARRLQSFASGQNTPNEERLTLVDVFEEMDEY